MMYMDSEDEHMVDPYQEIVIRDIKSERNRQIDIWDEDPDHICSMWLTILSGRMGKLSLGMLHPTDSPAYLTPSLCKQLWNRGTLGGARGNLYHRTVQLAAVAVAFAEQLAIAGLRESPEDEEDGTSTESG